jgi:Tfp pilus assembly protein PilO|tara:strand:- start:64 stop:390 length:327 start_codon:yes stop_codon:yes gene_type:complete
MQKRNNLIIILVSIFIIIFGYVGFSPKSLDKINNFIEQPPHNSHYNETIITKNINNVKVEILKHTLVKINDDYLAFSNHDTKMISIIPDEDLIKSMQNSMESCSKCHY